MDLFGQRGCIWAKLVAFVQKCLYLVKVVVFEQKLLYLGKVPLFGQGDFIRAIMVVFG